jgi:hypothetical protein
MAMRQVWTLLLLMTWASSAAAAGGKAFSEPWRSEPAPEKTNESMLKKKKGYEGPQGTQRRMLDEVRKMSDPRNRTGRTAVGLNGGELNVGKGVEKGIKREKGAKPIEQPKPNNRGQANTAGGRSPNDLQRSTLRLLITRNTSPAAIRRESKRPRQALPRIRRIMSDRGVAIGIGPR